MWKRFGSFDWCLFIAVLNHTHLTSARVLAIDCGVYKDGITKCSFAHYDEVGLKLFQENIVPPDIVTCVNTFRNNPFFEIDLNIWLAKNNLKIKRYL